MKNAWSKLAARVDAMSLRERVIIFAALATFLGVVVYSFGIDAEFAKSKRLRDEIAQRQGEIKALQDQVAKTASARGADPDRANRERLGEAKAQSARIESRIAEEQRKFTAPDKMRLVLEELLAKNRRVTLLSLKTVPVSSITEERAAADNGPAGQVPKPATPPAGRLIYRHGIELSLAGGYLDLLAYLGDLERLPTQLYWSALSLESQYPVVTMKVTVFTLSLDPAWLSV